MTDPDDDDRIAPEPEQEPEPGYPIEPPPSWPDADPERPFNDPGIMPPDPFDNPPNTDPFKGPFPGYVELGSLP